MNFNKEQLNILYIALESMRNGLMHINKNIQTDEDKLLIQRLWHEATILIVKIKKEL